MWRRSTLAMQKKLVPIAPHKAFKLHTAGKTNLPALRTEVEVDREGLFDAYRQMALIRRMELVADQAYKLRKIRGFCHLYIGQEAICVGMESRLTFKDSVITAYREHGWHVTRGGTPFEVFAEMFGKQGGCSKGKGGSMHMYNVKNNFYGGNGIVGAQVPVGAGIAWGYAYGLKEGETPKNVCVALYGDGAANQGQIFEAYNISALHHLPVIYVCENNQFGMGTSKGRASANPEMYRRCEYIPGLFADGMDFFAIQEATRYAKEWCTGGHGPMIIELDSYRYMGHSMSDPDAAYRSRDDINNVRATRDCIEGLANVIKTHGFGTEQDLQKITSEARAVVEAQYADAMKAPETEMDELYTDVLIGEQFPVRSCQSVVYYQPKIKAH